MVVSVAPEQCSLKPRSPQRSSACSSGSFPFQVHIEIETRHSLSLSIINTRNHHSPSYKWLPTQSKEIFTHPIMAPLLESPPSTPHSFSQPRPRPPRSPGHSAQIRAQNRRRVYLERNSAYFQSSEHELAGAPLPSTLTQPHLLPLKLSIHPSCHHHSHPTVQCNIQPLSITNGGNQKKRGAQNANSPQTRCSTTSSSGASRPPRSARPRAAARATPACSRGRSCGARSGWLSCGSGRCRGMEVELELGVENVRRQGPLR